ncbi:MAG: hypothetical protein ABWY02_08075 [Telluria sp.]
MVRNKQVDAGAGNADGVNKGPDSLSGRSDPADPDTGQTPQTGQDGASTSGHYTGGTGAGRGGGIVSAPPESNVGPPGAPQSSRGSATKPIPGGTTGTASEESGGAPGPSADKPGGGDTR